MTQQVHAPLTVGKYLISPLIHALEDGWFACSVSIRSGRGSGTTDRVLRLTRLFAGVLELVNEERDKILGGIGRYARGQNKLADRIRDESDKIGAAKDSPSAVGSKETDDLETQLKWDKRIFEERGRSLTYVCETPVLLERRLFDIARRIQQRL